MAWGEKFVTVKFHDLRRTPCLVIVTATAFGLGLTMNSILVDRPSQDATVQSGMLGSEREVGTRAMQLGHGKGGRPQGRDRGENRQR